MGLFLLIFGFGFMDWFESGGWILCVFLPLIGACIFYAGVLFGKK